MKYQLYFTIAIWSALALASAARGNVVEFDEVHPLPANFTPLAGTSIFAVDGITFAGQTEFVSDARFVGAGTDAYGIVTGPSSGAGVPTGVVLFDTPLTTLTISALSIGTGFVADVYNGSTLLNTFTGTGSANTTYFTHTFTGHITKLDFHDDGGYVGIGEMTFVLDPPAPEPNALLLIPAFGVLMMTRRPARRA